MVSSLDPEVARNAHMLLSSKGMLYVDKNCNLQRAGFFRKAAYKLQSMLTFDIYGKHAAAREEKIKVVAEVTLHKIMDHLNATMNAVSNSNLPESDKKQAIENAVFIVHHKDTAKRPRMDNVVNIRPVFTEREPTSRSGIVTDAMNRARSKLTAKLTQKNVIKSNAKFEPLDILEKRIFLKSMELINKASDDDRKKFIDSTKYEIEPDPLTELRKVPVTQETMVDKAVNAAKRKVDEYDSEHKTKNK